MKAPSKVALTSFLSAYLALASISSLQNQVLAEEEQVKKAEIAQATQTETKLVSMQQPQATQEPQLTRITYTEKIIENQVNEKPYEVSIETKYSIILEKCRETNAEAIQRTRKVSGNLEKSIEKYGFEYVVGIKNDLDKSCLDLTLKMINAEVSEADFEKEKEKLAREQQEKQQKTNVSAPINFTSEKMINAQKGKISADIDFYKRLLRTKLTISSDTTVDYNYLITSGFSQQEYEEIVSRQLNASNRIYDEMTGSRTGLRGFFAVPEINAVRNVRMNYFREEAEKVHKPENKQANKQPDIQETKQSK